MPKQKFYYLLFEKEKRKKSRLSAAEGKGKRYRRDPMFSSPGKNGIADD